MFKKPWHPVHKRFTNLISRYSLLSYEKWPNRSEFCTWYGDWAAMACEIFRYLTSLLEQKVEQRQGSIAFYTTPQNYSYIYFKSVFRWHNAEVSPSYQSWHTKTCSNGGLCSTALSWYNKLDQQRSLGYHPLGEKYTRIFNRPCVITDSFY